MGSSGLGVKDVAVDAERPDRVVDLLVAALGRGDNAAIQHLLCREVCFLTQDATAVYGRDRVVPLIAQLIDVGVEVRPLAQYSLQIDSITLVSARWRLSFRGPEAPLVQTTEPTLVVVDREGRWKLLLVAPWGCLRSR